MKKLLLILLVAMSIQTNVMAQAVDDEYVPMAREGMEWYYCTIVQVYSENFDGARAVVRKVWFEGDTTISDKVYKKCFQRFLAHDVPVYGSIENYAVISDRSVLIAYVRDEGKKVYAIYTPEYCSLVYNAQCGLPNDTIDGRTEWLVYDFNDMVEHARKVNSYWEAGTFYTYSKFDTIEINGTVRDRWHYGLERGACTIEGIGQVNDELTGMANFLSPLAIGNADAENPIVGYGYPTYYHSHFAYVTENGENVFNNPTWMTWIIEAEYTGINEVLDNDSKSDTRWYNLLGQPFNSRPIQPGIYIHQGRKVVIN
ncbi:MAG: hypothetical protein J5965_07085 [Aeriscardovia sp.]|nr:hypothetical protein [Aeriscardovia sp.]